MQSAAATYNEHSGVAGNPNFCGIVTLADSNYFPGLKLLCDSVRDTWPVPITCFDIGLTVKQREIATDQCANLQIRPLPETDMISKIKNVFSNAAPLAKTTKRVWPLWICPFLIAAAPYQRVFWLDCDIVVLSNLESLYKMLEDGPVFTPENNAPEATPNRPELYELLPIHRTFDPLEPRVNGGVSGWDLIRDRSLLEAYMYPITQACDDERVRSAISWHDQGALIWAIQKFGMEHRVVASATWNLCVSHTSLVEKPIPWDEYFLNNIRDRVAYANLLHWNGTKVPWIV
jgi:hypothetical protein